MLEWLTQFKDGNLTEHHRTALALAHAHGEVTNASLRHSLGGQSSGPLPSIGAELREVADYIGQQGQATRGDVERTFGLKASTAAYRLKRLRVLGYIEYTGKAKSKDVGYRLTATAQSAGTQASPTS